MITLFAAQGCTERAVLPGSRVDVGAEHLAVLDGVMAMVGEHSHEG